MELFESALVLKVLLAVFALAVIYLSPMIRRQVKALAAKNEFGAATAELAFSAYNILSGAWLELQPIITHVTEDGRVTAEEYKLLMDRALDLLKQKLGAETILKLQQKLGLAGGPIDDVLRGVVAQVIGVKLQGVSIATAVTTVTTAVQALPGTAAQQIAEAIRTELPKELAKVVP